MITPDDDLDMNSDRDVERVLRRRLESLVTTPPEPSPALAELLRDGFDAVSLPRVRRRRRWLLAFPITVALLGGTVGAASANVLPDAVQGVVSDTVGTLTPLDLPKPHKSKPGHEPAVPAVPGVPGHPVLPTLPPPAQVAPRATPTHPGPGRHGGPTQLPTPAHRPTDVPRGHATR